MATVEVKTTKRICDRNSCKRNLRSKEPTAIAVVGPDGESANHEVCDRCAAAFTAWMGREKRVRASKAES